LTPVKVGLPSNFDPSIAKITTIKKVDSIVNCKVDSKQESFGTNDFHLVASSLKKTASTSGRRDGKNLVLESFGKYNFID
jgi:hypothetical protein